MKKYEYRCEKCMIIEVRWILYAGEPPNSVFCHKCNGAVLRHPEPKSKENLNETRI